MRRITRSYRIRTYPNGAQRRLRDRWFGAYTWLWNTALEIRTAAYRECGLTLTGNDLSRWLTQWKGTQGHEWLKAVPATSHPVPARSRRPRFATILPAVPGIQSSSARAARGACAFKALGAGGIAES
jgi:hypothetical protein